MPACTPAAVAWALPLLFPLPAALPAQVPPPLRLASALTVCTLPLARHALALRTVRCLPSCSGRFLLALDAPVTIGRRPLCSLPRAAVEGTQQQGGTGQNILLV